MTAETTLPTPPVAEQIPVVRRHHGEDVTDPYEWLRDKKDHKVIAHLEAENAYLKKSIALKAEKRSRTAKRPRS